MVRDTPIRREGRELNFRACSGRSPSRGANCPGRRPTRLSPSPRGTLRGRAAWGGAVPGVTASAGPVPTEGRSGQARRALGPVSRWVPWGRRRTRSAVRLRRPAARPRPRHPYFRRRSGWCSRAARPAPAGSTYRQVVADPDWRARWARGSASTDREPEGAGCRRGTKGSRGAPPARARPRPLPPPLQPGFAATCPRSSFDRVGLEFDYTPAITYCAVRPVVASSRAPSPTGCRRVLPEPPGSRPGRDRRCRACGRWR